MFIYSMRASTLKFFGVILLSVITLIILIAFIPTIEPPSSVVITANQKINYANIKTNEDRIAFLAQFGHKVRPEPVEEKEITIPGVFDCVMTEYNNLQKQQGFDLTRYERKKVTRYTYIVENFDGYNGTVYANILVYRNKVIAGDLCSADINGFADQL